MKKLLKFLLSLVITGVICVAIYEIYPTIRDTVSDRVLPVIEEVQNPNDSDISYTTYPSVASMEELRDFIIDHREAAITEFSFIYAGNDKIEPLMLAEIYGASHISWSKKGDIYHVTVTEFPGNRIVKAYQTGDDSALNAEEKEALQRAVALLEEITAQTEDSWELERLIYETLCGEITYYTDKQMENTDKERPRYVSAVGALVDGLANCQGYTDAFYTLGTMAGFRIGRLAVDTPTMGHMVNTICLNDQWYIVDVTYGDSNEGTINYRLFNAGMDMVGEYWWNREIEPYPIAETTDESLYYYYVHDIVFDNMTDMADYICEKWCYDGMDTVMVMLKGESDGSLLQSVLYDSLTWYNIAVSYRIIYHSNGTDTFYSVLFS